MVFFALGALYLTSYGVAKVVRIAPSGLATFKILFSIIDGYAVGDTFTAHADDQTTPSPQEWPRLPDVLVIGPLIGCRDVNDDNGQRVRVRVTGGDVAPEWAAKVRPPRAPWCDVSILHGSQVGAYGGEVWPSAWPHLFESTGTPEWPHGTTQNPAGLRLTAVGRFLVEQAVRS